MKRYFVVCVCFCFALLFLTGCGTSGAVEKVMPAAVDYTADLDINTPEGLAQESSEIYRCMLSGEISAESGYERLLAISSEQSAQSLRDYQEEFVKEIEATKEYFLSEGDAIERFEFAQTEYSGADAASIRRIQVQQDGKKYYFNQDYVLEDGQWRIKGDNLANDFVILRKFLLWYL